MNTHSAFAKAVEAVFLKISEVVFENGLPNSPVKVYLAGGAAVYLYTGTRVSQDVDAEFEAQMHLPEVVVTYTDDNGEEKSLHLDQNYRQSLGPIQGGYADRANPLPMKASGFDLHILAPVDLIISKLGRFADHDRQDIRSLIAAGLASPVEFRELALDTIKTYVGNTRGLQTSIDLVLGYFKEFGYDLKSLKP